MFRTFGLLCPLCLCSVLLFAPELRAAEAVPSEELYSSQETLLDNEELDSPDLALPPEHAALPELPLIRGICTVALHDTGLLDYLGPLLTQETGLVVQWKIAGDSQAVALARTGENDILFLATPEQEQLLIREGYAHSRQECMSDGYILAGPQEDPAGVRDMDIVQAFQTIADKRLPFLSRGDASGTARWEATLWKKAERRVRDGSNGYAELGQGSFAVLDAAQLMGAYTLVDEASFLTWKTRHPDGLVSLIRNQPALARTWSLLPLSIPAEAQKNSGANETQELVQDFRDWWLSPATQKHIAEFTREGQPIFTPLLPTEEEKVPTRNSRRTPGA